MRWVPEAAVEVVVHMKQSRTRETPSSFTTAFSPRSHSALLYQRRVSWVSSGSGLSVTVVFL